MTTDKEISRFWSYVDRSGDCWLWTKSKNRYGYGQFWFRGHIMHTHRVSWIATNGDIPDKLFVCHRCDVRACVNPSHLFLGTQRDNLTDMRRKGRGIDTFSVNPPRGTKNVRAKLTDDNIRAIRARYAAGESLRTLGREFHVGHTCISSVVNRKTWAHIT